MIRPGPFVSLSQPPSDSSAGPVSHIIFLLKINYDEANLSFEPSSFFL